MATNVKDRQDPEEAEVLGAQAQPLQECGRPRGFLRKFGLCRICFRLLSLQGYIPGVTKASW